VDWANDLCGRVALVTGGAERVGAVVAEALAAAGADVVVNHLRQADEANRTVARVREHDVRAIAIEADVSSGAACRGLVDTTIETFGRLDILVHNANTFVRKPFLEITEADFEESLGVGLRGPLFLSQAAATRMLTQGGGKIVALVGNSLYEAWPEFVTHSVAKAGMARLMELLAVTLSPTVQCNGIALDRVDWNDTEPVPRGRASRQENVLSIDGIDFRTGTAADVARLVVELCKASGYLNGAIIPLDGGKSRH
jgi:NAD(P)-dependent dehydrogenase (short-subunit alcohol dehydrogenase family)